METWEASRTMLCHSFGLDSGCGDLVGRTEQDTVCAAVSAECYLSDEQVCADIAECDHAESTAFFQHGVQVD